MVPSNKNKRKVKLIIMRKAPMTDKVETAGSSPVWANNENKELENRVIKLSKQERKYLGYAITAANMSTCKTRHGAVLVKNGNVLAIGVNALKNNPHIVGPDKPNVLAPSVDVKDMMSVHAEESVIRANSEEADNAVVYIARLAADGEIALSKPCEACQRMLKKYGVKKAIWTIAE